MKHLISLILAATMLLCLAACGNAEDSAAPHVSLTDVAADAVPADEIVPADIAEVAAATEEMILAQPMEQPAFNVPSSEPAEPPTAEEN